MITTMSLMLLFVVEKGFLCVPIEANLTHIGIYDQMTTYF